MAPAQIARLLPIGPLDQLRAGKLTRRLAQLFVGLWLFGWSMAMMVRGVLGLPPWDVLHEGMTKLIGLSFGTIVIIVGAVVLLAWIPLRQRPGLGTVANVFVVGLAAEAGLAVIGEPDALVARLALLLGGVVLNGLAGALYIGAQLGPGPRDGLMTGFAARTGCSLRVARTGVEVSVLLAGLALGGTVGIGTLLYAFGVGPLVQLFLPYLTVTIVASPR